MPSRVSGYVETRRMSCGNCGGKKFSLFANNPSRSPTVIEVECLKCHSTTVISVAPVTMQLQFGEKSDGILCFLESDTPDE